MSLIFQIAFWCCSTKPNNWRISKGEQFVRGDFNSDGTRDLSDPIRLLGFLFSTEVLGECDRACDATDDGLINLADVISSLDALFTRGASLVGPGPDCGLDTTPDNLACVTNSNCP